MMYVRVIITNGHQTWPDSLLIIATSICWAHVLINSLVEVSTYRFQCNIVCWPKSYRRRFIISLHFSESCFCFRFQFSQHIYYHKRIRYAANEHFEYMCEKHWTGWTHRNTQTLCFHLFDFIIIFSQEMNNWLTWENDKNDEGRRHTADDRTKIMDLNNSGPYKFCQCTDKSSHRINLIYLANQI